MAGGRESFARRAWTDAYALLSAADEDGPLDAEDLERLALAAYALNQDYECARAWTRAHHEWVRREDPRRASRCAFLQACSLFVKGEMAPALGWTARGRRILEEYREDCAEQGWLLEMTGLPFMFEGDAARALTYFAQANEIAERFEDQELLTLTRLTRGHSLIQLGKSAQGLALLDEAMVAVTAGEVDPLVTGIVYCQVIATCQEIFDLRRAREWTESLSRWCDAQPDLVPYRGDCLIYRCEIFVLQGAWPDAQATAEQACEKLAAQRAWATLGPAHYQLAEIHRLRGDFESAEMEYRRATEAGRDPEPGLSLLRLGQGRVQAAVASIGRLLGETERPISRARVLPSYVEIMLAAGDIEAAEPAARELASIAEEVGTQFLHAASAYATGSVMIAQGDARGALDALRGACRGWQELDAPYEAARARVVIARCCRALGDHDAAARDLDSARSTFLRLGAAMDVVRVDKLAPTASSNPAGLSRRELEVLILLAKGKTNRQISSALVVSENTVARHVQNIFTKLGVSSRAAAGAFAFEHHLV